MKKPNKTPKATKKTKATKKPFIVELEEQLQELGQVEFIPEDSTLPPVEVILDADLFTKSAEPIEIILEEPNHVIESPVVEAVNKEIELPEKTDKKENNDIKEEPKPKEAKKPVLTYKQRLEAIKARLTKYRK